MNLPNLSCLDLDLVPFPASQFIIHSKQGHKNEQVYKGRASHNHCVCRPFVLRTWHSAHQGLIPSDKLTVTNINQGNANRAS